MVRDTLRGRFAGDIRVEIERIALIQLADGGPAAVSINAIARSLDVSGPALYRYFSSRDDLLTALIVGAYRDLARTTGQSVQSRGADTGLMAFASSYRQWAGEQPHRYRLLFRAPLPGYDTHAEPVVKASQAVMNVLLAALAEVADHREPDWLDGVNAARWAARRGIDVSLVGQLQPALVVWGRLHGLVSLEIEGNFASVGVDPDAIYRDEIVLA